MSRIGVFHYKVGGTDGVSLEIDKWKRVLEELGHEVYLCAGNLGALDGTLVESMYHHTRTAERMKSNMLVKLSDYPDNAAFRAEIEGLAQKIETEFTRFVEEKQIDLIIPENVWSVAANPAVALALARVMRKKGLKALAHSHDFYWERIDGVALTCSAAVELADKYLPPRDEQVHHVVINSLAQQELLARKGIASTVVPNVFDFNEPPWEMDEYNQDFRERIGLKPNDIILLQATRIVQRKGIELAVDFAKALNTPERREKLIKRGLYDGRSFDQGSRIVLVLAGYSQDDLTGWYTEALKDKIQREHVDAIFIEELIAGRRQVQDGKKFYSLWDTYVFADLVTYPSLWEGWGNQLLEALRAKLPVMLYEYPVFKADIKPNGLKYLSLGNEVTGYDEHGLAYVNQEIVESVADDAVEILSDGGKFQEMVAHNFDVGCQYYSMEALQGYLKKLMDAFE